MALYLGNNKVKLNAYSGDYKFKDGKLIWANPDLYIASTGNPSINTGYICNVNTKVECVFSPNTIDTFPPTQTVLFGTGGKYMGTDVFNFNYWLQTSGGSVWWPYIGTSGSGAAIPNFAWEMCEKYKVIMNGKTNGPQELYYNNGELIRSISTNHGFTGSQNTLFLFKTNGNEGKETAKKRIYSFKIYEDDVLIHNFVPVPAGLQIGSFTVPSNGMFDIVEQKFYANSGSGEFEYGKNGNYVDQSFSKVKINTMQGDYLIKDGKLLWANPDLYLKSSGTQYIDTGYVGNNNTRIETDFIYNKPREEIGESGFFPWNFFYGSYNNSNATGGISLYIYEDKVGSKQSSYFEQNVIDKTIFNKGARYLIKQDKDGLYINKEFINSYKQQVFNNTSSTCLFTINKHNGTAQTRGCSCISVYYFKIYENNILVRHLVPVPAGLQIGSFTVPSNGMFDIVEQTFYANQGTGEFEFGGNQSDYVISDGKLLWANKKLKMSLPGTYGQSGVSKISTGIYLDELGGIEYKTATISWEQANYIGVNNQVNSTTYVGSYGLVRYIEGKNDDFYNHTRVFNYDFVDVAPNRGSLEQYNDNIATVADGWYASIKKIDQNIWKFTGIFVEETKDFSGTDIPHYEILLGTTINTAVPDGPGYSNRWVRYYKLYDLNNNLIRYYVPVKQGLVIGNFITPSVGMFDIVEQKFYGNEGTGEFLINKDE